MNFIYLALLSVMTFGCAEERSEEERDREIVEREVQRLQLAETSFVGVATKENDLGLVPLKFQTRTLRNPNGDKDNPVIEAELKLGLFGGVSFRSEQTSYDFGTKRLVVRFSEGGGSGGEQAGAQGAGAGPGAGSSGPNNRNIEWQAIIENGVVNDAMLITSIGTFAVREDTRFSKNFSQVNDQNYTFLVKSSEDQTNFLAKLTIENLEEDMAAPPGFTVPRIPRLRSALRFTGTSIVPQNALKTQYDPLKGTLEMFYPGAGRILIPKLALQTEGLSLREDLSNRSLTGSLFRGAEKQSNLIFTATNDAKLVQNTSLDLPPEKYFGTYLDESEERTWDAAARIEYVGDVGVNNEDLTFRSFPQLKLTLYRCDVGSKVWLSRKNYTLRSIDYITSTARFTVVSTLSSGEKDLVLRFGQGWKILRGKYLDGTSVTTLGGSNYTFDLKADEKGFKNSCTK